MRRPCCWQCPPAKLTICARETYEVGTDRVVQPELLRAYNELLHRVTSAVTAHILGGEGYSPDDILEILQAFGNSNGRTGEMQWALDRPAKFV